MEVCIYESEIGRLKISSDGGFIREINITDEPLKDCSDGLILKAKEELTEYFEGKRSKLTFPIKFEGTEFQKSVWNELLKIPYGEVRSYEDIAVGINNKGAIRAVGSAVGKNHLLIIVPCHRVINKNGNIGGFACGIEVKKKLLKTENIIL